MRSALVMLALVTATAAATPHAEERWLGALTARVTTDLAAGRPLVVEVHVPLCEATIIPCGNAKLGDGDTPGTNLYWSTTPGFGVWFARRGAGWRRVARQVGEATGDPDVLEQHVYRRTVTASAAWRAAGAPARFELDVIVRAWRGTAIDRALATYAQDVSGGAARGVRLDDGTELTGGGAAQVVAWVGHNRLMDLAAFTWPAASATPTGAIAIACHTAAYMEAAVPGPTRVPLLLTRDYLFANAAPLEASVLAFARGAGYAAIRQDAATAYAGVRQRTVRQVAGAFTNPADRRWRRR